MGWCRLWVVPAVAFAISCQGSIQTVADAGSDSALPTDADGASDGCLPVLKGTPVTLGAVCCNAEAGFSGPGGRPIVAVCENGRWCGGYYVDIPAANSDACPTDDYPAPGSPCPEELLSCIYHCPRMADPAVANCNAGAWCGVAKPPGVCAPKIVPGDAGARDTGPLDTGAPDTASGDASPSD